MLTAAVNRVETAEQMTGAPLIARVVDPTQAGTSALEKAWHFLLVGFESGYMYYGTALDFEIKPTLAAESGMKSASKSMLILGVRTKTPPGTEGWAGTPAWRAAAGCCAPRTIWRERRGCTATTRATCW